MVRGYQHVRNTLQLGSANFDDPRYRYAEKGQYTCGIPQALFKIGKGIALLDLSRRHQPQVAWFPIGLRLVSS